MRNVVLVAPYCTPNTLRYVEALVELDGVRPAVISADSPARMPKALRERLAAFAQVENCLDAEALAGGGRRIQAELGEIDRMVGVLEQLQLPVAQARDALGVEGMSAEVVNRFRDKSAMKKVLREAGVPCARYARVTTEEEARRFVDEVGFPVVIKPVAGLGTRATWRLENEDQLLEALTLLRPSASNPVQCEEFLLGTEHSFETVTVNGEHVWSSSTNYIPGPLEVMNTPWIQYCVVLPRETEEMARFEAANHAALHALGMQTGLSHMELFLRGDGSVAVNEVGARPPGVNIMPLMSAAHGVDFVRAWVRLMALDEFEPPVRKRAAGTAFLRGQGKGRKVAAVQNLDEVLRELGPLVVEVSRPRVGQGQAPGYEGEGYVIVAAPSTEEVMGALAKVIRNVRVVLA